MQFLDLLKLISSIGPKLKEAWPHIQAILALILELKSLLEKSDSPAGVLQSHALEPAEEAELENIAALLGGDTAMVDISALVGAAGIFKSTIGKALAMLLMKTLERYLDQQG